MPEYRIVNIEPKVIKNSRIYPTIIKKVGEAIERRDHHKIEKKYSEVVECGGSRFFVVFLFYEDGSILIKNIRYAR